MVAGLAAYVHDNFKSDLGFKDLDWLCGWTRLPVVVKGVCRGDDARRAAEHGAKAVVVSNHGGRQLDTAPATCEVLPSVADAVSGLCEVYVDGGIRRGSDVLKAIALGARAVLIGRPILWGLCVGGEQGAINVLEILRRELDEAMLLCGCTKLGDINRSLLVALAACEHLIAHRWPKGERFCGMIASAARSRPIAVRVSTFQCSESRRDPCNMSGVYVIPSKQ